MKLGELVIDKITNAQFEDITTGKTVFDLTDSFRDMVEKHTAWFEDSERQRGILLNGKPYDPKKDGR